MHIADTNGHVCPSPNTHPLEKLAEGLILRRGIITGVGMGVLSPYG
jgi:hypothetical protein